MRVDIVLFDGFDELDAIAPYEVLRTASALGADLDVRLVTREPAARVTASHGLDVVPHGVLDGRADLVLVPGGGWSDRSMAGAWGEAQRGDLPAVLAGLAASGARLASVCTGGMILAAAGLLTGRPATTHRSAMEDLAAAGAKVVEARVVDDGDIVTAGGVTSGLDLALWLVEREAGPDVADAVAREVEYERTGEVRRRG